ncbi:putative methionyl-tRNA synthetase [Hordeum vulgare]|nr:putative methionyl-tRNA synthetase [Hordeum vulgare]
MEGPTGHCVVGQPLVADAALGFNDTDADLDEIITSGFVAAASYPGFSVQDETMDTADDTDDGLDDIEEEEGRKSWSRWNRNQCRRRRGEEKVVSIDPITDANQNTDAYWGRIKTALDERNLVDPDFVNIHMDRDENGMSNHWSTIHTACNKWHVIVEEVVARPKSGANVEGQIVRMFAMYRTDNEDQEFKFLHVFSRIDSCRSGGKFGSITLDKVKDTYNPNALAPAAAEWHPDGTKKARVARDAAPAVERLQASIEQCIADAKSSAPRREEKSDGRWLALMTKQDVKLDLLRTNVVAQKRNTDLAFLIGAYTSTMDE